MDQELRHLLDQMSSEAPQPGDAPEQILRAAGRRRARSLVTAVVAAAVVAAGTSSILVAGRDRDRDLTAAPSCQGDWISETLPDSMRWVPHAVAVIQSDDVWAATYDTPNPVPPNQPPGVPNVRLLHWGGAAWTPVPFPMPPGASDLAIWAIDGERSDDVWAAGAVTYGRYPEDRRREVFLLHWDGAAWRRVEGPSVQGSAGLTTIAVRGDDVWVAGSGDNGASPFMSRWDGGRWSEVALPQLPAPALSVSQLIPRSNELLMLAWNYELSAGGFDRSEFALFRLRDDAWSRLLDSQDVLTALSVATDGTLFVAGYASGSTRTPVLKQRDGTAWRDVKLPESQMTAITAVIAGSAEDVWVIGASEPLKAQVIDENQGVQPSASPGEVRVETWTAHWDGSQWTSPRSMFDVRYTDINAVDSLPDGTTVAVGWGGGIALVLRRC